MRAFFNKETNIVVDQELYGIIAVSTRTYDGVYKVVVSYIDWDKEIVIFDVDQPCRNVYCFFSDFSRYVHENGEDAEAALKTLDFGEGLNDY